MEDKNNQLLGDKYCDNRGVIRFVNSFDLYQYSIKRFYIIDQDLGSMPRAWQGHKYENKYLYCVHGEFNIYLIKPDNWDSPSGKLNATRYPLSQGDNKVLMIPGGYISGIIAKKDESSLLVFSDKSLHESESDDYRFNMNQWVNWQEYV